MSLAWLKFALDQSRAVITMGKMNRMM